MYCTLIINNNLSQLNNLSQRSFFRWTRLKGLLFTLHLLLSTGMAIGSPLYLLFYQMIFLPFEQNHHGLRFCHIFFFFQVEENRKYNMNANAYCMIIWPSFYAISSFSSNNSTEWNAYLCIGIFLHNRIMWHLSTFN